jgi:ATP-binding cassette, subfamily B (MDR/TAP), member 8
MSPQMTILTIGILPAIVVVGAIFGRLLRKLSLHAQMQGGIAAGVAAEAFQNVRTVKMFSMEEAESKLYHEEVQKARALNEKLGLGIGSFQAVSNLFLNGERLPSYE